MEGIILCLTFVPLAEFAITMSIVELEWLMLVGARVISYLLITARVGLLSTHSLRRFPSVFLWPADQVL